MRPQELKPRKTEQRPAETSQNQHKTAKPARSGSDQARPAQNQHKTMNLAETSRDQHKTSTKQRNRQRPARACPCKSSMDVLVHDSIVRVQDSRIPPMPHQLTYSITAWAQAQVMQSCPAVIAVTSGTAHSLVRSRSVCTKIGVRSLCKRR